MAAGAVPVASPVGVVHDYIDDGRNGFLARNDSEWIDRLTLLIDDVRLRRDMACAARETIEARYAAARWAPEVERILVGAAGTRRAMHAS